MPGVAACARSGKTGRVGAEINSLELLNAAEPADAEHALLACCASRRWADEMLARRPYPDLDLLLLVSGAALEGLDWAGVREALDAHPRIGDRPAGAGTEATWSRDEQAAAGTDESGGAELRAANVEYEDRFGHVFLICATGRSAPEILAALRERLGHDEETEREVVRAELAAIVALRLGKLVGERA